MKKLATVILFLYSLSCFGQATGVPLSDYPTGGILGPASTTVDVASLFNINQTTPGQTVTMPTPSNTAQGKNITVTNIGNVPVNLNPGGWISPGTGVILRWVLVGWSVTGGNSQASTHSANEVYAAPAATSGLPSFRPLVQTDIPTNFISSTGSYANPTWITSLAYAKLTGTPSIPAPQIQSDWTQTNIASLDYIKNKPTIPSGQVQSDWTQSNTSAVDFIKNKPVIPVAQVNSDWASVSGITQILNKPTIPTTTTQISEGTNLYYTDTRARGAVSAGSGISYNSATGVVTNSAPDQTVVLTAGSGISITGTYPNFTISLLAPVLNNAPGRSLNSNFTPSAGRYSMVCYAITCAVTNPLLSGSSSVSAFLEYSTNSGSTWNTLPSVANSSGVALTVTIQITNGQKGIVWGIVPPGAIARIRTTTSGTATATLVEQFEFYFN